MDNYISINLNYLLKQTNLSQDDFGKMFDLKRGSIGRYLRKLNEPKIQIIQKICDRFNIDIDAFITSDLRKTYGTAYIPPFPVEELPEPYTNPAKMEDKFRSIHLEELVRYLITHEKELLQSDTFRLWIENKVLLRVVEIYREERRILLNKL